MKTTAKAWYTSNIAVGLICAIGFVIILKIRTFQTGHHDKHQHGLVRDFITETNDYQNKTSSGHCNIYNPQLSQRRDVNNEELIECVPTKTKPSVQICIYPPIVDVYISAAIVTKGGFELFITKEIVEKMMEYSQATFIDVGANIGMHSLVVAKTNRSVVGVEPMKQNLIRIKKSIKLNRVSDRYVLVGNAVSDVRGSATLDIGWKNSGGNTLEAIFSKSYNRKETVSAILMDDLLEVVRSQEAVIKIDIEGAEPRAFRKAQKLFSRVKVKAVFMEWLQMKRLAPVSQVYFHSITTMIEFFSSYRLKPFSLKYSEDGSQLLNMSNWRIWPNDIVWKRA